MASIFPAMGSCDGVAEKTVQPRVRPRPTVAERRKCPNAPIPRLVDEIGRCGRGKALGQNGKLLVQLTADPYYGFSDTPVSAPSACPSFRGICPTAIAADRVVRFCPI